jgi:hypothetical protein
LRAGNGTRTPVPDSADCSLHQSLSEGQGGLHVFAESPQRVGPVHKQVYDEYNVSADQRNIQDGEVDHLYPMCAGGSNNITNQWYQPVDNKWKGKNFGYHEKDALETYVCKQIVAGNLDPKEAYKRFTTDWVAYYLGLHLEKSSDGEVEAIN